jgi:uncharacterized protein YqgV (UPF0045/DUF77 family)
MADKLQINAAIQLLPIGAADNKYELIDDAIALIKSSGLNYKVCPFETVVEGNSEQVYALIWQMQEQTLRGCGEILINVKIHAANRDLSFSEKLEKY